MFRAIPSFAYLWLAVVIFATSNSIVKILIDLGSQNAIDGRNPITFCNLLCAGNMCAVLPLLVIYWKQWTFKVLRTLSLSDWASLILLALLTNTLAPWLFFYALDATTVTNVVLVSQIEPPLVLVFSLLILGEGFGLWAGFGALLCVVGVALSVLLQPNEGSFMIGKGELFVALAAAINAFSTIIAKQRLSRIPMGIFTVFRNMVGTLVFFGIANYYYGPVHFVDLASPYLWKWMLLYGGIIIVGGQTLWFTGLKSARSLDVSLASSSTPIAGVLAAFLILGEQPVTGQYIGGAVLICGIIIGLLASRSRSKETKQIPIKKVDETSSEVKAERGTGFKGI
jgi:drug/metabolite transporter (DMT)-like permease